MAALLEGRINANPGEYFRVEVVDEQTGRGVPFVELTTTTQERFFTDSNGLAAVNAPELMGRPTWFSVASHGYEYPADPFGFRGVKLTPEAGKAAKLRLKRLNIAERLYRVTGAGIYRDTVLLGEKPPIAKPLINAEIAGQDSVVAEIYKGRIFWVWGDTARLSYPLGHFATAGAVSELPGRGGLDPSIGINHRYFVGADGFSRGLASLSRPGLVWTDGLLSISDDEGRERLLSHYVRMKDVFTLLETGLMVFNDETEQFEVLKQVDLDAALMPGSHPIRVEVDGREYVYSLGFYPRPMSYAHIRVKADWTSIADLDQYEGYTCLKPRGRFDGENTSLDRDGNGRLTWSWKRGTPPLTQWQVRSLIEAGKMKPEEAVVRLVDVDTGEQLMTFGGSIRWNDYRKRWILITANAPSEDVVGGETYFAEANAPEGPWVHAKKVATHSAEGNNYDFYNPVHHGFFDQEGGRIIYFQGTLSTFFSKNKLAAPRYSYNQLMYRLDLSDPRLDLPNPPPGLNTVRPAGTRP